MRVRIQCFSVLLCCACPLVHHKAPLLSLSTAEITHRPFLSRSPEIVAGLSAAAAGAGLIPAVASTPFEAAEAASGVLGLLARAAAAGRGGVEGAEEIVGIIQTTGVEGGEELWARQEGGEPAGGADQEGAGLHVGMEDPRGDLHAGQTLLPGEGSGPMGPGSKQTLVRGLIESDGSGATVDVDRASWAPTPPSQPGATAATTVEGGVSMQSVVPGGLDYAITPSLTDTVRQALASDPNQLWTKMERVRNYLYQAWTPLVPLQKSPHSSPPPINRHQ